MITITNLNKDTFSSLPSGIFTEVLRDCDNLIDVTLSPNAIIKTSDYRDHVTIDLGAKLFDIDKKDFFSIEIR